MGTPRARLRRIEDGLDRIGDARQTWGAIVAPFCDGPDAAVTEDEGREIAAAMAVEGGVPTFALFIERMHAIGAAS